MRDAVDLKRLDVQLVAALGTRVGPYGARHRERRFLRQVIGLAERVGAHGRLGHHGLDEAGSVAHDEEMNLAARAAVVQPALNRHALADVAGDRGDGHTHRKRFGRHWGRGHLADLRPYESLPQPITGGGAAR